MEEKGVHLKLIGETVQPELSWKTHGDGLLGFLYTLFHFGQDIFLFFFNIKEVDQNMNPVRLFLQSILFFASGSIQVPCYIEI